MYCPNCGKHIIETSKFCKYCGHKFPSSTSSEVEGNKPKNKKLPLKIIVILIAIGIILLFATNFLSSKGFIPVGNNKASLEQRFNKLISLQNEKNCTESYDNYVSVSEKTVTTREDYCKSISNTGFV